MNVKQISINIWRLLKKENTVDMIFKVYLKRFKKYAFTEGQCVGYEQYEAVITKLYHSIEKGLAFEEYRPGFGEKNIDKLIRKMEQYSCQYDVEAFFYRTALSVLKEYVAKNEKYGLKDEKLKGRIDNLLGKSNYEGGIFQFTKSDILTVQNKKFDEFIKSRHSIRHFSNIPVELDKIKDAIKLAQLTPSACNRQGWECKVVCDKQVIHEILKNQNGNRGFGEEIDKLIVVISNLSYFSRGREAYQAFIDGGMYSMNVLHALHFYGVGSIPLSASLNVEQEKNVRRLLKIKENEILIMLIGCGNYPDGIIKTTNSARRPAEIQVIK